MQVPSVTATPINCIDSVTDADELTKPRLAAGTGAASPSRQPGGATTVPSLFYRVDATRAVGVAWIRTRTFGSVIVGRTATDGSFATRMNNPAALLSAPPRGPRAPQQSSEVVAEHFTMSCKCRSPG